MLDDKSDIVRVAALTRVKSEAEANERAVKEVSAEIRARMETGQSERERS